MVASPVPAAAAQPDGRARKIAVLTRYTRGGASSRLRFLDFVPGLERAGWQAIIHPFFDEHYVETLRTHKRPPARYYVARYLARLAALRTARRADVVWVEKELLPWLPAWIERALLWRKPFVVDMDDAWFHRYDQLRNPLLRRLLGRKIDAIMAAAEAVICANDYVAERAVQAPARSVVTIATMLDPSRYTAASVPPSDVVRLGWIGSRSTAQSLCLVREPVSRLAATRPVTLHIVGADRVDIPHLRVTSAAWSEATEIDELSQLDIGLAPMIDSPFARGKSGFKILQYFAMGLPVVASPVGLNAALVTRSGGGFLANTPDEWHAALRRLADDPGLRQRMGQAGRAAVVSWCDKSAALRQLLQVFATAAQTVESAGVTSTATARPGSA